MAETVVAKISHVGEFGGRQFWVGSSLTGPFTFAPSEDLARLVQVLVQLEMSKEQGEPSEESLARVVLLEEQMGTIIRRVRTRETLPVVEYVDTPFRKDTGWYASGGLPGPMLVFYGLGLLSCIVFGTLLAFSSVGTTLIHPFLSLLGLVGGLGWVTTAWTDLLVSRRNKFARQPRRIGKDSAEVAPA